jgi:hypothetical protein
MPEAPPVVGGSGTTAPIPAQFSGKLGGLGAGLNPTGMAAPAPVRAPMPAVAPVPVRAPTRAPVAAAAPTPANPKGMFTQGNALAIPDPVPAQPSPPSRISFGQNSFYTPGSYSGRFLGAKDIEYAVPGSVAEFYGITGDNIFASGQHLNKFQRDAVQQGITTGGNAGILADLRSNKNLLGQQPAQAVLLRQYLSTGTAPEGLSSQFATNAYDWAIREQGRKQQNKPPSVLQSAVSVIKPIVKIAAAVPSPIQPYARAANVAIEAGQASAGRPARTGSGAPAAAQVQSPFAIAQAQSSPSAPVAGLAANVNPKGMFMRGNTGAIPAPVSGLNMRNALTG